MPARDDPRLTGTDDAEGAAEKPLRLDRSLLRSDTPQIRFIEIRGSSQGFDRDEERPGQLDDSPVSILDYRMLLEASPDGMAVVDEKGHILVANQAMCEQFCYSVEELVGNRVELLIPERLRESHLEHRQSYSAAPAMRPMGPGLELVGRRRDGTELPVEICLSPLDLGGQVLTIATVRDVSVRMSTQREREHLHSALEMEQERNRIGMDLHDGIMQDIFGVSLSLEIILQDVENDTRIAKESLVHSIDQLHGVLQDIRSYIFELRPRQFTGDIRDGLLDLGHEFQQNSSIATEVDIPPNPLRLDEDVSLALYAIVHEALSNTRKYAQASNVLISLQASDGNVRLLIRDDGRGFDTTYRLAEEHRGFRNMASRASRVGADFQINSAPGEGTVIQVACNESDAR